MGGKLRSRLDLKREQAEKLRLTREIAALRQQLQGLRSVQARALSTSTQGIRATFSTEVSAALEWDRLASELKHAPTDLATLTVLEQSYAELEPVVKEGQRVVTRLLLAFSKKGDQMASQLAQRLVQVRTLVAQHEAECATWFPADVARWSTDWERASELHDQEQFGAATEQLHALETNIEQTLANSRQLSAQRQARMYLLRSVRQVCCGLGMRELAPPRHEHLDDPSSRILLTVSSPDRGRLRLSLTLDGIQTQGEAHQCLKDLDQLSQHLAASYGIRSKFRAPADQDEPTLTGGRRRELPADSDTFSQNGEG